MRNSAFVTSTSLEVILAIGFSARPVLEQSTLPGPAVVSAVAPNHPQIAKASHVYGEVVVEVKIDDQGKVGSASAISGHELLRGLARRLQRSGSLSPHPLVPGCEQLVSVSTFGYLTKRGASLKRLS